MLPAVTIVLIPMLIPRVGLSIRVSLCCRSGLPYASARRAGRVYVDYVWFRRRCLPSTPPTPHLPRGGVRFQVGGVSMPCSHLGLVVEYALLVLDALQQVRAAVRRGTRRARRDLLAAAAAASAASAATFAAASPRRAAAAPGVLSLNKRRPHVSAAASLVSASRRAKSGVVAGGASP